MFRAFLPWLLAPLLAGQLHATEVDSFTDRDPYLRDSIDELNAMMEGYLNYAVEEANQKNSCKNKVIERALEKKSGILPWSIIEVDIENNPRIDKRRTQVPDSIYQDIGIIDGFALHLAKLGFLLRVNGMYMGSDKFGHFIQQGHTYFEIVHRQGGLVDEALNYGETTERTYYGLSTTAIYSHGDLAANFEGLKFWQRVTGLGLTEGEESYFKCNDGKWTRNTQFDWRDFISYAWDEGINCSRYKTSAIDELIKLRVADLESVRRTQLQCPIEPRCAEMLARYGSIAPHIITEKCF